MEKQIPKDSSKTVTDALLKDLKDTRSNFKFDPSKHTNIDTNIHLENISPERKKFLEALIRNPLYARSNFGCNVVDPIYL